MNPFESKEMALGYARSRPPLHRRIVEHILPHLPAAPHRALDLGCGSGLSTHALAPIAAVGLEPAESMTQLGSTVAPAALGFLCARSEQLPFRDASFDLLTAAGSLNYADLPLAFAEAARVLSRPGALAVYDFSTGRFSESWFERFVDRYPWPRSEARSLDPDLLATLAAPHFHRTAFEHFSFELELSRDFYLNYMLTETNVASAARRGIALEEIRAWCDSSLRHAWPVGATEAAVTFRGYWTCLEHVL